MSNEAIAQAFGLICEGFQVAFIPEVAYVKQKDKVLFFLGESAQSSLNESVEEGQLTIVESLDDFELEERTIDGRQVKHPKNARWTVEGPYQRSDTKNANGRRYALKIWERIVGDPKSKIQTAIREGGGLLGHLEHPADGRTSGKEGTIATRSLKLREDGVVWGKSDLLDTPNGLILQEYTKKNLRWGVSSRGNGSVSDTGHVNEDYELETFDAVMRPSTPGAYPKSVHSSRRESEDSPDTGREELTEEAERCVSLAKSLVETEVEGLDEAAQTKLAGDLLSVFGNVNSLASSGALPRSKADELQNWLTKKLQGVHEGREADWDAAFEQALETAEDDDVDEADREAALRRVVSSFQRRIHHSVQEAEEARRQLEEAQETLEAAEARVEQVTQERDQALELLESSDARTKELEEELSIARGVIADQSEAEVQDLIKEAVDEAIGQVPGLKPFRHLLERAESADEVEELAEELLPALSSVNRRSVSSAPDPGDRRALPTAPLVESETGIKGSSGRPASTSRGARVASRAVKQLTART